MEDEIIFDDPKTNRVCGKHDLSCAFQLWVIQYLNKEKVHSRVLYGRVLPYYFCDSTWHSPTNDKFESFKGFNAQLIRINLYESSSTIRVALKMLGDGENLRDISKHLSLTWERDKDENRFGDCKVSSPSTWRSPVYLPMRYDFYASGLQSVHSGAGCFSASLIPLEKQKLFEFDGFYSKPLIDYCVDRLDQDTGLDFAGKDLERIGDIELITFPQLDDRERGLFSITWSEDRTLVTLEFDEKYLNSNNDLLLQIIFLNGQFHIHIAALKMHSSEGQSSADCQIPEHLSKLIDGYQIEVFNRGQKDDSWSLLFRDSGYFLREITTRMQINSLSGKVKSKWFDSYSNESSGEKDKVQAIKRDGNTIDSNISYREFDPWIPANRNFIELVRQLVPEKTTPSNALFLLSQHEDGKGGRLKFADWFQKQMVNHSVTKIFIFDPYFDTAGIDLIAQAHSTSIEYIVFTTQSDRSEERTEQGGPETPPKISRIERIINNCEQMKVIFKGINIKIYALPSIAGGRKAFHDRYILGSDNSNNPTSGFHLSNSIQTIQMNYPLLITPIPPDVLNDITNYAEDLLKKTSAIQTDGDDPAIEHLIFDSHTHWKDTDKHKIYNPFRFADYPHSGDVLAAWFKETSFENLSGKALIEKLKKLGLSNESGLNKDNFLNLGNTVELLKKCSADEFQEYWPVVGILLASTPSGDQLEVFNGFSEQGLRNKLFSVINPLLVSETTVPDTDEALGYIAYWNHTFEHLLRTGRGTYDVAYRKLSHVDWPQYYAIKILWQHDAPGLIDWLDTHFKSIPQKQPYTPEQAVTVVIGSQIVSEISMGAEFGMLHSVEELLESDNALLRWIGYCALENNIFSKHRSGKTNFGDTLVPVKDKRQFVSWALSRQTDRSKRPEDNPIYDWLYSLYMESLPDKIDDNELDKIVRELQSRMQGLQWLEPWLTNEVIFPLLNAGKVDFNTISKYWFDELENSIKKLLSEDGSQIFSVDREGILTALVAFYVSKSSEEIPNYVIKQLQAIYNKSKNIIRQPLASTSNWQRYDTNMKAIFWCTGLLRWLEYFSENYEAYVSLRNDMEVLCDDIGLSQWKHLDTPGTDYSVFLGKPPITVNTP